MRDVGEPGEDPLAALAADLLGGDPADAVGDRPWVGRDGRAWPTWRLARTLRTWVARRVPAFGSLRVEASEDELAQALLEAHELVLGPGHVARVVEDAAALGQLVVFARPADATGWVLAPGADAPQADARGAGAP